MDWGARSIYQRGDGGEEEEEGGGNGSWCRGDDRGDDLSPADEVCTRRRTVGYDRTAPAPKDEKVTPALSTGGGPPATQMEFHNLVQLCEATTSRSSTMLSKMTFFYVWNASTSRLIR